MKKPGVRYSWYFNKKYQRTGHLFQDRYRSEKVEDDAYLVTVYLEGSGESRDLQGIGIPPEQLCLVWEQKIVCGYGGT